MKHRLREIPALLASSPGRRRMAMATISLFRPLVDFSAGVYRRTLLRRMRVVAVVGSFGKTTTTQVTTAVMNGQIHRWGTNNSGVFVALNLIRVRLGRRHHVIEVGISRPGTMARPAWILWPDVVVVTSIGSEHNRSFETLEATTAEKSRMVEALRPGGLAVLNGDDEYVLSMRDRSRARVVTFGFGPENDFRASEIRYDGAAGTHFLLHAPDEKPVPVRTRLLGPPGVRASLAALTVALSEGLPIDAALAALAEVEAVPGRLAPVLLANGALVLSDEFKSSYETVETALDVLAQIPARRRICVLGDVTEPPGRQGPIYRELGERVAAVADMAIFVGEAVKRYTVGTNRGGMPSSSIVNARHDFPRAIAILREELGPGDVVLVKGRSTERLDRVVLALQGLDVRCTIRFCDARATRCRHCKMLERGWSIERPTV